MSVTCPKCGGGDLMITEMITVADWIEFRGGIVTATGRGDADSTLGFHGRCCCGHTWRLRRSTGELVVEAAQSYRAGI